MKKSVNMYGSLLVIASVFLFSCSSNGIDTQSDVVDVLPEIGVQSSGAKVIVDWSSLSSTDLTTAQDELKYFSCSPLMTGISKNPKQLKVGDTFTSTFFGVTVTTVIAKDSEHNIVYTGTMDNGSYKMTYYPKTKTFDYEQGLYFSETSGANAGSTGTPTYAYIHCAMTNVALSDEGYFHCPMTIYMVESMSSSFMMIAPKTSAEFYYGKDASDNLIAASYIKSYKYITDSVITPTSTNQSSILASCEEKDADDSIPLVSSNPFLFILTHGDTDTLSAYTPWDGTTPALPFTSLL